MEARNLRALALTCKYNHLLKHRVGPKQRNLLHSGNHIWCATCKSMIDVSKGYYTCDNTCNWDYCEPCYENKLNDTPQPGITTTELLTKSFSNLKTITKAAATKTKTDFEAFKALTKAKELGQCPAGHQLTKHYFSLTGILTANLNQECSVCQKIISQHGHYACEPCAYYYCVYCVGNL